MKKSLFSCLTLGALALASSNAAVIWNVGDDDNSALYTAQNPGPGGGGRDTRFVQEGGGQTGLPGNSASADGDGNSDDDYYLAGDYQNVVDGGAYATAGLVAANENNAERAFLHNSGTGNGGDRNLRYHFNFPATVSATDLISVTFGITGMETLVGAADGWDVEVSINGVSFLTQGIDATDTNGDWTTPTFTLADINGTAGAADDNYVQLRGTSRDISDPNALTGGSRWLSLDYVEMDVTPIPEPGSGALAILGLIAASPLLRRRR